MIDRVVITTVFGRDIDPLQKLMVTRVLEVWLGNLGLDGPDRYSISYHPDTGACTILFTNEDDAVLVLLSGPPEEFRGELTIEYEQPFAQCHRASYNNHMTGS